MPSAEMAPKSPPTAGLVEATTPQGPAPVRHLSAATRRAISRTKAARALALRGNTRRLKHGVYAVESVRPEVLDEAAMLYARAPWLDPVRDGVLVEATARIIVRLRRLDAVVDAALAKGPADIVRLYEHIEGQLTRNLAELGLTPSSAAALGLAHLDARDKARRLAEKTLAEYRSVPDRDEEQGRP